MNTDAVGNRHRAGNSSQLATRSKIFSAASPRPTAPSPIPRPVPSTWDCPGYCRYSMPRRCAWLRCFGLAIGARGCVALRVRPQELLLSRSAQGLPDQPVRAAHRAATATLISTGGRQLPADRHHPCAPGRRCRQVPARGFPRHDRHRPQPGRHALAGNRLRTRFELRRKRWPI